MKRCIEILVALSAAILAQGVLAQPAGPDQEGALATGEAEIILPAPEWYAVIRGPGGAETLSTRGDAIFLPENPIESLTVREVGAHAIVVEEGATGQTHTVPPGHPLPGLSGLRFLKAVALDHLIYRYLSVDGLPRPDPRLVALHGSRAVLEVEVPRFLDGAVALSPPAETSPLPGWESESQPVHAAVIRGLPGQDTVPYEDETLIIWAASSLEKIGKSYDAAQSSRGFRGRVELSAARNEYESFQIAVGNKANTPIQLARISVSDFRSLNGRDAVIAKEHVTVSYVGYVNGLFPDVLFPADLPRYQEEFRDVTSGETLTLWVTVYVPSAAEAGEYGSTVEIHLDGRIFTIPVYLRVWGFALPQRSQARAHLFAIDRDEVAQRYNLDLFSDEYEQFVERIFDEYERHRISPDSPTPIGLPIFLQTAEDISKGADYFARWCNRWLNVGLDCNKIEYKGPPKDFRDKYLPIYELLMRNEWMENVYIRLPVDEVLEGPKAEENLFWAEEIRRVMPGVKRLHTFGGLDGRLDPRHIEFYSGSVEIWCFGPDAYFGNAHLRSVLNERVATGEELCWYIHNHLKLSRARRDLRYVFWQMWSHRVSRIAFWRTTFWSKSVRFVTVGGKRIRIAENTTWRTNRGFISTPDVALGDGVLFWPDSDRVLSSVRLAILRDGIEDYEYWALAGGGNIPVRIGGTRGDENAYMAERNVIAEKIEQNPPKF